MSQLDEKQLEALRAFLALVHEAERDLSESFETGMMIAFAVVAVCKPSCRWITFNFKFNFKFVYSRGPD